MAFQISTAKAVLSFFLLCLVVSRSESLPGEKFPQKLTDLLDLSKLSSRCSEQLNNLSPQALLTMFDASTKIATGLLDGNFFDLGNFDECYSIEDPSPSGTVYGKYCLGTIPLTGLTMSMDNLKVVNATNKFRNVANNHTPQPRLSALGPELTGFHWAICVPHGCTAEEISVGLSVHYEALCSSKQSKEELSSGAIATIVFFAIILFLTLLSTIYDFWLHQSNSKPSSELFLAFSVITNGSKIFNTDTKPDQLLCLNGIRAISMMWVVYGHLYSNALYAAFSNLNDLYEWKDDTANMFVLGATVSVDTFFVVGGLVVVYTFMKSATKEKVLNISFVIIFYVHRYLRLTPALGAAMLVHANLLRYLGDGPLWTLTDSILGYVCREKGWWATLLYISNYFDNATCIPQTWYLAVDMQLYFLTPLILLPMLVWPKKVLGALGILSIAGIVIPLCVTYYKDITTYGSQVDFMRYYYASTYSRFGPYVIGMILGYHIYQIKAGGGKLILKMPVVITLWLISITGLVACVFAGNNIMSAVDDASLDKLANAFYNGFNRPAWAVAVSIAIYLCVTGNGGPINTFLSLPIFTILTRLSYATYLAHYCIVAMRYLSMRSPFRFSNGYMMHSFWGDFMLTLVFALILCLTFESPAIILEKHLIRGISEIPTLFTDKRKSGKNKEVIHDKPNGVKVNF